MSTSPRYIIGGILVGIGALLLVSNLNLINLDWIWDFALRWWPVLIIAWALWDLVHGGFRFRMWPIVLLLVGLGLQLSFLGLWEWEWQVVWPVFIVIVGLAFLLGRHRRRHRRQAHHSSMIVDGAVTREVNGVTWRAAFNNVEERYAAQDFRGGEVEANFANLFLDLREAAMAEDSASLVVTITFAGVRLQVPPNWRVNSDGVTTHRGEIKDEREVSPPETSDPVLHLTGTLTFGHLNITD